MVLVDGRLVLYVERGGRTLLTWSEEPALLGPATAALAEAVVAGRWAASPSRRPTASSSSAGVTPRCARR